MKKTVLGVLFVLLTFRAAFAQNGEAPTVAFDTRASGPVGQAGGAGGAGGSG